MHLNPMSGRWIPDNSYRQRHINAAIAFNIWQYYQVSEDREFLYDYGAELMLEIARFWASLVDYDEAAGRYAIRGVMGPDEFHTAYPGKDPSEEGGLDNNAYTNCLVSWSLTRTLDVLDLLPDKRRRELCDRLDLSEEEFRNWDDISRNLIIPFHGDGVISQFEGYEDLQEFDWEGYREQYDDIQRLDRILEKEGTDPNRYMISKQADVLMLFFLFSTEELAEIFERLGYDFSPDTIFKTIHYYMQRTSHGSTLSWVTHAWVLARADRPRSWQLLYQALDSDFADLQGGTTSHPTLLHGHRTTRQRADLQSATSRRADPAQDHGPLPRTDPRSRSDPRQALRIEPPLYSPSHHDRLSRARARGQPGAAIRIPAHSR
jgi:alpha,alpha-trehalase